MESGLLSIVSQYSDSNSIKRNWPTTVSRADNTGDELEGPPSEGIPSGNQTWFGSAIPEIYTCFYTSNLTGFSHIFLWFPIFSYDFPIFSYVFPYFPMIFPYFPLIFLDFIGDFPALSTWLWGVHQPLPHTGQPPAIHSVQMDKAIVDPMDRNWVIPQSSPFFVADGISGVVYLIWGMMIYAHFGYFRRTML